MPLRIHCLLLALVIPLVCFAVAEPAVQWPKQYALDHHTTIFLYPPQVEAWDHHEQLSGRSVFGYKGEDQQQYGSVEFRASTVVNDQQVTVQHVVFSKPNFPLLSMIETQKLLSKINMFFADKTFQVSKHFIDVSQGQLPDDTRTMQPRTTPPDIIYRSTQAILLQTNGKALLAPIDQLPLKYVINSSWDVFFNSNDKTWYLRDNKSWLKASGLSKEWHAVEKLPPLFSALPDSDEWENVQKAIPAQAWQGQPPEIIYRDHPSELLVVNGKVRLSPITKNLSWVTNTDADLFYDTAAARWYYLVSGRWFSTSSLEYGRWLFSSDNLPEDFSKIPKTHPKVTVLAQVPGTPEANEAAIQASIPKQGTVSRETTAKVSYAGQPEFKPVAKDNIVYRATNANYPVFRYQGRYYMCKNAMWFTSDLASGPWALADEVPAAIYAIPSSSPDYNVTYVSVAYATPSSVTYVYTPGYYGVYVSNWSYGATVVFGTGWYYPPCIYYPIGRVPVYYPYPATYGRAAWYNVNTGFYGHGGAIYGPYSGAMAAASFNPRTGTYRRTAAVWNANDYRGSHRFYNPRFGVAGRGASGGNDFAQFGRQTAVSKRGNWVSSRYYQNDNGFSTAHVQSSLGNGTHVTRGESGNVFASRDGNIYKQNSASEWQHYNNGQWEDMQRPARPTPYSSSLLSTDRLSTDIQNREFQAYPSQNHQYLNRQAFSRSQLQGRLREGSFRRR